MAQDAGLPIPSSLSQVSSRTHCVQEGPVGVDSPRASVWKGPRASSALPSLSALLCLTLALSHRGCRETRPNPQLGRTRKTGFRRAVYSLRGSPWLTCLARAPPCCESGAIPFTPKPGNPLLPGPRDPLLKTLLLQGGGQQYHEESALLYPDHPQVRIQAF